MDRDVAARLAEAKPDVVFNALHGTPGEDGSVQGMLDLMGLNYTHSGLATSVIAIDKVLTKQALVPHGIPMPGGRIVKSAEVFEGDPLHAALCAEAGQRRLVGRRRDRHRRRQLRQPDRPRRGGAVAGIRRTARRAVCPRARADHRGARRPGARRDRAQAQERLVRLRRQIYRRDDRARLSRRRSPTRSPTPASASRSRRTGCSAARARRAPISAGTTSAAWTGCSCSRSTPSRA